MGGSDLTIPEYLRPVYFLETITEEQKADTVRTYQSSMAADLGASFQATMDSIKEAYMEYEWDDVIDEMCFDNIDYFEPSSRFDVSCSNSIEPWRSYTNDVKYKLIKYFNLASVQRGTCTTIDESELGPAFSIMTACAKNGA